MAGFNDHALNQARHEAEARRALDLAPHGDTPAARRLVVAKAGSSGPRTIEVYPARITGTRAAGEPLQIEHAGSTHLVDLVMGSISGGAARIARTVNGRLTLGASVCTSRYCLKLITLRTEEPIEGAALELLDQTGPEATVLATGTTDADGLHCFDPYPEGASAVRIKVNTPHGEITEEHAIRATCDALEVYTVCFGLVTITVTDATDQAAITGAAATVKVQCGGGEGYHEQFTLGPQTEPDPGLFRQLAWRIAPRDRLCLTQTVAWSVDRNAAGQADGRCYMPQAGEVPFECLDLDLAVALERSRISLAVYVDAPCVSPQIPVTADLAGVGSQLMTLPQTLIAFHSDVDTVVPDRLVLNPAPGQVVFDLPWPLQDQYELQVSTTHPGYKPWSRTYQRAGCGVPVDYSDLAPIVLPVAEGYVCVEGNRGYISQGPTPVLVSIPGDRCPLPRTLHWSDSHGACEVKYGYSAGVLGAYHGGYSYFSPSAKQPGGLSDGGSRCLCDPNSSGGGTIAVEIHIQCNLVPVDGEVRIAWFAWMTYHFICYTFYDPFFPQFTAVSLCDGACVDPYSGRSLGGSVTVQGGVYTGTDVGQSLNALFSLTGGFGATQIKVPDTEIQGVLTV